MVDVNKPVENPLLVAAIDALQKNPTAETESTLFEQLRQAHFLLVLQEGIGGEPDADGKITLAKDTTISIPMLSDADGHPLYFGFTDWPSLYAWRNQPDQQTLIVPFDDLPGFVLREDSNCTGFLINPSTQNFFLPRHILAGLCGRANPQTVQKETQVLLGEPADYPHALVGAVKTRLKTLKEVKRAWLMLMMRDNEQSYLIVLEHSGDRGAVSQAVGSTASPNLPKGMFVDIVTTDQDFGRDAVRNRKPFYKRGLFG